jgi:phage pi2 protein 07
MRFPDQFQQTWREKLQNCSKILSYRIFKETFIFKQYYNIIAVCKKSLKIPKGQSEYPYIEEEQTTQWREEKVQKEKQRSTKDKTKDRIIRTPLKTGVELRCCGWVSSSCSTSYTCRVNLVANR